MKGQLQSWIMARKNRKTKRLVGVQGADGIGTLNEGSLHGALKRYIDPDETHWEQKRGRSVCDIVNDDGVFEIQTRRFYAMQKKLTALLPDTVVTVVYPIVTEKLVYWVEPDTGDVSGGRKSPRKGKLSDVLKELPGLGAEIVGHKNFRLRLVLVTAEEYKYRNGWSDDGKRGASRMDRVLTGVVGDVTLCGRDIQSLLPETLPASFTAKDAAKGTNLKADKMSTALKLFTDLSLVRRIGRDRRGYIYEREGMIGMKKEMIACQCYSLRSLFNDAAEADATLKAVKEIGYDAVQLSGVWQIPVETLAEICKKYDLKICATHISYDEIVNKTDEVIANHKLMDCPYVGLGGMPKEARESAENCRKFIEEMNVAGRKLKEAGLTLVYHNHSFEYDIKFGDVSIMDILYEDAKDFQFELDTCWVYNGKADPAEWIRKVGKRMEIIHYKDIRYDAEGNYILSEIGNGVLEWDGIIEACRETGIRWYIVEQDTCPGHPLDSMKQSYDYLAAKAL